ncbi:rhomboid-related protein 2 isoform X1 [Callorhinchus milii]|uniref:rhomboid-related protein 2 isoform X1 n=1 Tax=Callorhinchus milii TaxID=7868 RepID=UPI001C3FD053|nr:rhomboid-related protein 2 isoform X1 [Callorhinchus milii]XP_042194702.1 rhomboid-related protein 2 isoform X1 [Callorhinchus milii]
MELTDRNREGDTEENREAHQAHSWCYRFQKTVSNWMLPEETRGRYLERANCLPPPIFIVLISITELAVFIYYAVWMPQTQWITLGTGTWESPFIYRPDKRMEVWRFISYMLVHAGVEHIMGNLVLQLVLGIPLELVHKGHRVGLVYLAGVLGGSLASSIFDPMKGLVGASGGGYALMGGYFMNAVVNFKQMVPLFGIFRLASIFLLVATDVGFALYRRFVTGTNVTPVSFVAHIAGGLAGMTIGYVIFSNYDKNIIKDPRFWACILAYVACVAFAVIFNIFLSPAP